MTNLLRPRTLLLAVAVMSAAHALIWCWAFNFKPSVYPWPQDVHTRFEYWDAWHYNAIIENGYTGIRWAFYPLYPLLVRVLTVVTGLRAEIAGTIFSTLTFAAFCLMQARLAESGDEKLRSLRPETIWGWLFFLFSPASWVFHSHHTESLFLLLSFGAFLLARNGSWKRAAVLAGLCSLTRNQGMFVALAVACESALRQERWTRKALVFGGSGFIALLFFACYPAYQYWQTGDALKFVHIQREWGVVLTFYNYLGTLWYVNPWQHADWKGYLHEAFFFILNATAIGLLIKRQFPLALYVFLSLWAPLYSGHFQNTYRYGAVLFPALFLLGDSVRRAPLPARYLIFACFLAMNFLYTYYYAVGHWAY
jgi:hypothetical protein